MREVVVIGAGVIGSALAMHLSKLGSGKIRVRVADADLEGSLSSSELNAGGVRATWGQPLNIELSKRTIEYMEKRADEVGYRACGYLWLAAEDKIPDFRAARALQLSHGWRVEEWTVEGIRSRIPFLDRLDGVEAGFFGARDGLVNPNLLKRHFREEAVKAGAEFVSARWLVGTDWSGEGARLRFRAPKSGVPEVTPSGELLSEALTRVSRDGCAEGAATALPDGVEEEWRADLVVNCAGPWASSVARALGYVSPAIAQRRQIALFECREVDLSPYGMIVDPSGVYFHPEATFGLSGYADPAEQPGMNYEYDGASFFEEKIWPPLAERSSFFERLKHVSGWAGQYEISPDHSAIVGEVSGAGEGVPQGRLFEAHSFSGHGVMQSHAAALELARAILGLPHEVDLAPLSGARFGAGQPLSEMRVI